MALEVLHVDNHLLVCRKPAGVPAVPDESGDASLLDEARAWVEREFSKPGRAFLGVVHRLDRPVSGVLVFARTSKAAARLTDAFRERTVEKTYWGVSARPPEPARGRVEQWLRKDATRRRVLVERHEAAGARRAITRWRVLAEVGVGPAARHLLELVPETGRPHQLRVAAASLGAPLLGDLKYGAERGLPDRSVALHARRLVLTHPTTRARLEFTAALPPTAVWSFPGRT